MRDFIHRPSLSNVLKLVESNKEVYTLIEKLTNLSLNDVEASTSNQTPIPMTTETILNRYKRMSNPSVFTRNIMDMTKVPFMDIKKPITNMTGKSSSYMMALGFRFMPGQTESLIKEIRFPDSLDCLRNLRDSLGLTLSKGTLSSTPSLKLKGISDLIFDKTSILASRILVEAITYNEGYFGRFLVLVQMGVGCTVWYGFAPGDGMNLPNQGLLTSLFSPIDNYEEFFTNPGIHVHPGFNKMTLMEGIESPVTALAQAFSEEKPFLDIQIPATNQSIIVGVSLGLAIAILLTFGITPNCGERII